MIQYLELLRTIKEKGTWKNASRPNLPRTLSLFGHQYRFNLQDGFPILTTKKVSLRNISTELIWFLRGSKDSPLNIKYLVDNGCNIWNQDAYRWYLNKYKESKSFANVWTFDEFVVAIKATNESNLKHDLIKNYRIGDCPLGYELWRNFNGVDQIAELISNLKENPSDRGHQITALNPAYRDVALRPCHVYAQFNVREIHIYDRIAKCPKEISDNDLDMYLDMQPKFYLDCQLYQRSCDVFLGVPYNTASYALLTHIIAEICGFVVGDFVHTFGDVHIYENHLSAVDEQLLRIPNELPKLKIDNVVKGFLSNNGLGWNNISECFGCLSPELFKLENYNPQPSIKAELKTGL